MRNAVEIRCQRTKQPLGSATGDCRMIRSRVIGGNKPSGGMLGDKVRFGFKVGTVGLIGQYSEGRM